jgi:hypothetical protein
MQSGAAKKAAQCAGDYRSRTPGFGIGFSEHRALKRAMDMGAFFDQAVRCSMVRASGCSKRTT